MRPYRSWMMVLFMVMFAASLVACQTPGGRSAGGVVDDSTITSKVKAKLIADERLGAFGIDVDTFEGRVTMTGGVNTQADRSRASQIARSVNGVKEVNNLIQVKP